ncbi:MAG TPA: response regulator transcription factor [Candidatus Sulfotelmatobacter sp.]|jgi:DNA-binding response OmpR family regulator|nr:response regulator transcription factor [Candidatus Sulfotelmatobacter sp.]
MVNPITSGFPKYAMHILIVEDEPEMASLLTRGLEEESYQVSVARDGRAALELSAAEAFDVILLDVMLPQMDGLEVARQLRRREEETPVLMLTARDALGDIVNGLDAGADDYLTKPFSFVELLARMRALVRRQQFRRKNVLEVCDLVLDLTSHRSFRAGKEIYLSLTEFRLMELLARNAGRIVSRHEILGNVWGPGREVSENTLDAFVRLLRKKVDDGAEVRLIQTHRGFGYSLGSLNIV